MQLAQQGDQAACQAIVEALHRPVIATIFRFLGTGYRREVEDLRRLGAEVVVAGEGLEFARAAMAACLVALVLGGSPQSAAGRLC